MRGIDTNVLLRAALQDDPIQSRKAIAFLSKLTTKDPGYVSLSVALEFHWVLTTRYRIPRKIAASIFSRLLASETIQFAEFGTLVEAVHRMETLNADFADAVIASLGRRAGCQSSVTFDRKAANRLPEMELLE
ncbi:PIN domain-containing protein [Jiella avicenniae]|uniref:Type II toxin-antitoxin system VapC family toxin n=1 Tax=Jiella avicenniae TaxID=2907202 RepID=A0A9X1NXW9_9HYPH|nr:type II toxin-antitoxin system VapC family toxin [Jiella avicenniae]MCE7026765.1 type II toxin-antitoxin system VapC family toxin [Jiella avicenniae]